MKGFRAAVARFFGHTAAKSAEARQGPQESRGENPAAPQSLRQKKAAPAAAGSPRQCDPWGLHGKAAGVARRAMPESAATPAGFSGLSPVGRAVVRQRRIFEAAQETILDEPDTPPKEEARGGPPAEEASCEAPSLPPMGRDAAPAQRPARQLCLPKYSPLPALSPPAKIDGRRSHLLGMVERIAALDTSVLITGPSGSGKARCALYLHRRSARADRPFVAVSCNQEKHGTIEDALFGRGGGARSLGLVAKAEGGTLFLDEVDRLPLGAQVKLLRFLEMKEYRPPGGTRLERADVRIIAARGTDFASAGRDKPVLPDLHSRLRISAIEVPALADGNEDLLFLREASAPGCTKN